LGCRYKAAYIWLAWGPKSVLSELGTASLMAVAAENRFKQALAWAKAAYAIASQKVLSSFGYYYGWQWKHDFILG
jgi:hypothetical protein